MITMKEKTFKVKEVDGKLIITEMNAYRGGA